MIDFDTMEDRRPIVQWTVDEKWFSQDNTFVLISRGFLDTDYCLWSNQCCPQINLLTIASAQSQTWNTRLDKCCDYTGVNWHLTRPILPSLLPGTDARYRYFISISMDGWLKNRYSGLWFDRSRKSQRAEMNDTIENEASFTNPKE